MERPLMAESGRKYITSQSERRLFAADTWSTDSLPDAYID